jgi:hypothetical protein
MSWLFVLGQTGPSVVKASTSDMNQVSRNLLFYLLNKDHLVILHVTIETSFFIIETILIQAIGSGLVELFVLYH